MVFESADVLRAALALAPNGLRFQCRVCGKKHATYRRGWEKCARQACRDLIAGWQLTVDPAGREKLKHLEVVPGGLFTADGRDLCRISEAVLPPVFACALPQEELMRAAREAEESWWAKAKKALGGILEARPVLRRRLETLVPEFCKIDVAGRRRIRETLATPGCRATLQIVNQRDLADWTVEASVSWPHTAMYCRFWFYKSFAPATPAEFFSRLGLG